MKLRYEQHNIETCGAFSKKVLKKKRKNIDDEDIFNSLYYQSDKQASASGVSYISRISKTILRTG